ncbi:MAG: transporter substrate-binding domain-containing protein [Clostridia bacterium]|nr:transporter substrate-binding domain-containing protein [Clostridia bacterium]
MKKLIAVLATLVALTSCALGFAACSSDPRPTLNVYTNAGFAPYEYVNEYGEVVGVDIDIMEEIGEALGYNVVINDIDFGLIMEEVGKNELAVGAAGMTKTDERDEAALASISYAVSVQYVIAPKDSLDDKVVDGKVSLADLAGKKIGVQEATTGDYLVSDEIDENGEIEGTGVLEGTNATKTSYTNAIVASGDIGANIDVVVIDKLPAQSIVSGNANLECYELSEEPEQYVLYFNKNATELVAKVNKVLEKLIENGVIDYFTVKHSGGIVG